MQPLLLPRKEGPTFLVEPPDDVVHVVREEAPRVEDGGQHRGDGAGGHGLVIGVLVHLQS